MRNEFFTVDCWEVLMTRSCYFYNEDNTPFEAVCVRVGNSYSVKTTLYGTEMLTKPIVRWMTRKEYEGLKKYSGAVVF